jgi:hypothetical protein
MGQCENQKMKYRDECKCGKNLSGSAMTAAQMRGEQRAVSPDAKCDGTSEKDSDVAVHAACGQEADQNRKYETRYSVP